MATTKDLPQIGTQPVPALLYADDAVLMARTPLALQTLLTNFVEYMSDLGLQVNQSKTFIMKCGKNKVKCRNVQIKGIKIDSTNTFSYLGVLFDKDGTWNNAIENRNTLFSRACWAIRGFTSRLGMNPPEMMMKIYNAKCTSIALYGTGIWGHKRYAELQVTEKNFFRYLLVIPKSTSAYVTHSELGAPYLSDLIILQPILLRHKIWTSDHTDFNRAIINDCLKLSAYKSIPWLTYVQQFFCDMAHPEYFDNPETLVPISRKTLKTEARAHLEKLSLTIEIPKPTVLHNQMILTTFNMQPYLKTVLNTSQVCARTPKVGHISQIMHLSQNG